ncbi:hypothetical protein Tco_1044463 [Tanacetum coccineum]|uniref:Uncharacterized protein n=1 Tax=Tanacetum coccineum TaxID=301880 RepID=A0ABQ5GSI5_9ASTR
MANLSTYGLDVLSEVPNYDTYHDNIMFEQSVQEMSSEQPVIGKDSNIEITSDSNVISYYQYLKKNENEVVQSTTSPKQHDAMIMSVIDEMYTQVAKCNVANQENNIKNKSLTIELERYKELTLILAEESRINLKDKQNDPIVKEKKVNITPIDYASLNKLYEHFVSKKQLSAEQGFWLPISQTVSEKPSVQPKPVQNDLPCELPSISIVKESFLKMESHLDNFDKVIKVRTKVTR